MTISSYTGTGQISGGVFYCPYIPLQMTNKLPPLIEQIDEETFILRVQYDLTEKQIYAIDWVKDNVPKDLRKFESDMEDRIHLIKITLSEQYAVLFKMFVM